METTLTVWEWRDDGVYDIVEMGSSTLLRTNAVCRPIRPLYGLLIWDQKQFWRPFPPGFLPSPNVAADTLAAMRPHVEKGAEWPVAMVCVTHVRKARDHFVPVGHVIEAVYKTADLKPGERVTAYDGLHAAFLAVGSVLAEPEKVETATGAAE